MRRSALTLTFSVLLVGCSTTAIEIESQTPIVPPENFYFAPSSDAASMADYSVLMPFNDLAFQSLMRRTKHAPNLELALARVDAARAMAARSAAERKPALSLGGSASVNRSNVNQFGNLPEGIAPNSTRLSIGAQINAQWDPDIFGRLRNREIAAQRRLEAAGHEAQAVRIAITTEVAAAVIDWQNIVAQKAEVKANIAAAENRARLIGSRANAGLIPALDSMRAEALADGLRAQLAPLEGEAAAIVGRMVALTATPADQIINDLDQSWSLWASSGIVSAVPSSILATRPDIQAAAAQLAANDADLAAVAAQRYPRFTLSSALGLLAFSLGGIFSSDAITGQLGADIAAPLLDFGRIEAEIDQSKAQGRIAFAELRRTTFLALGEVEEGFGRLSAADREARLLRQQADHESDFARVTGSRYRAGLENFITVLDADLNAYTARRAAIAAQARTGRARLSLWQSLGGPL